MNIQNHQVAFCIPTCDRPEECQDTISIIQRRWPGAGIYVADDSETITLFEGVTNVKVGEDVGVSAKRNACIEASTEPYIFLLDDDMKLDHIDLERMAMIMHLDASIGVVAVRKMDQGRDRWANSEGDFFLNGTILHINRPTRKRVAGLLDWMVVDYAAMCFLAKRGVFRHVDFDERLKTCGEHVDFFFKLAGANGHEQIGRQLVKATTKRDAEDLPCGWCPVDMLDESERIGLGVALDPQGYVVDTGSRPVKTYNTKRKRGGRFRRQMMKRWQLKTITRWNSRVKSKAIY